MLCFHFQIRRLAFFDNRNSSHVTVVFNCMYNDIDIGTSTMEKLYALIIYHREDTYSPCIPLEYWASSSGSLRNQTREIWHNFVLRTETGILHHEIPILARLSTDPNCFSSSDTIPIKDNRTERVYTYGVCLHKSIFNLTDSQQLVHWVELNLALGVEIMTIYLQYVPESFYTIMLPYIRQGIVEVLDWGLKPPLIPSYTKFWGQTSVITECHYRNLYRVKYLGLYDLDEFIIPQENLTIPEMIKSIEKDSKVLNASSYVIYNAFFYLREQPLPELNQPIDRCPEMEWPRYYTYTVRSRRPTSQHPYHKIIIKPKAVISAWTHWVNKHMDGYTKEHRVSERVALTQHYRHPEKKPLTPDYIVSFTISRYFNKTVQGIIDHVCH